MRYKPSFAAAYSAFEAPCAVQPTVNVADSRKSQTNGHKVKSGRMEIKGKSGKVGIKGQERESENINQTFE